MFIGAQLTNSTNGSGTLHTMVSWKEHSESLENVLPVAGNVKRMHWGDMAVFRPVGGVQTCANRCFCTSP